jgi:hypothetical protein
VLTNVRVRFGGTQLTVQEPLGHGSAPMTSIGTLQ